MITTKQINVNLSKGKIKLRHVTTKDIDAGVRVEPPKAPIKKKSLATITTTTLPDVADVAEKKRRDDIAEEKKLAMKDEKKIVMVEKEKVEEGDAVYKDEKGELVVKEKPEKTIEEFAREAGAKLVSTDIPIEHKAEKKPWKEMTDEEKKVVYKERAVKAKATRARKKEDSAKYTGLRR